MVCNDVFQGNKRAKNERERQTKDQAEPTVDPLWTCSTKRNKFLQISNLIKREKHWDQKVIYICTKVYIIHTYVKV